MVRRIARFAWRITYARYVMASAISLGVDLAIFLLLLRGGMPPVPASLGGYITGLGMHWLLSSRLVFAARRSDGRDSQRQKLLFIGSALVGLAITGTIVGVGHRLGIDPRVAKLGAVAVSFQATYWLRRSVVFA